jgi:DNA-binding transcriptional LysR family regulator
MPAIMIRELYRMAMFVKIDVAGSFSKAAAALGLGKSIVSQHMLTLERSLDTQLINRSPRAFSLTQEGRRFYDACLRMTEQAEAAPETLDQMQTEPRGTLRISASYNLSLNFLIGALADFQRAHPKVEIDFTIEDSITNIVESGYDLCLRTGWLKDSQLYAVRLGSFRLLPYASPAYIGRYGWPEDPAELANRGWVSITPLPTETGTISAVFPHKEHITPRLRLLRGRQRGIAALCIGGGEATAITIERAA